MLDNHTTTTTTTRHEQHYVVSMMDWPMYLPLAALHLCPSVGALND